MTDAVRTARIAAADLIKKQGFTRGVRGAYRTGGNRCILGAIADAVNLPDHMSPYGDDINANRVDVHPAQQLMADIVNSMGFNWGPFIINTRGSLWSINDDFTVSNEVAGRRMIDLLLCDTDGGELV